MTGKRFREKVVEFGSCEGGLDGRIRGGRIKKLRTFINIKSSKEDCFNHGGGLEQLRVPARQLRSEVITCPDMRKGTLTCISS